MWDALHELDFLFHLQINREDAQFWGGMLWHQMRIVNQKLFRVFHFREEAKFFNIGFVLFDKKLLPKSSFFLYSKLFEWEPSFSLYLPEIRI